MMMQEYIGLLFLEDEEPFTVNNLNITTGTYTGGQKRNCRHQNFSKSKDIDCWYFSECFCCGGHSTGRCCCFRSRSYDFVDEDGVVMERIWPMGAAIYDMDATETIIAVVGDFGVTVLNPDFSIAWTQNLGILYQIASRYCSLRSGSGLSSKYR